MTLVAFTDSPADNTARGVDRLSDPEHVAGGQAQVNNAAVLPRHCAELGAGQLCLADDSAARVDVSCLARRSTERAEVREGHVAHGLAGRCDHEKMLTKREANLVFQIQTGRSVLRRSFPLPLMEGRGITGPARAILLAMATAGDLGRQGTPRGAGSNCGT
jgi:hypothetical protein